MEYLERDIFLLDSFIYNERTNQIQFSDLTCFANADYIYPWTNEKLYQYYEKELSGKRVLSVTSSGDHLLHAVLGGSKDIVAFDINHFAKYYAALKIALIKKYYYDDFFDYIECLTNECPYLFLNIIKDVKEYLTTDQFLFWIEYIKIISSEKYLLSNPETLFNKIADKTFNAYYNKNTYKELKSKLKDVNIRYIDANINELLEYNVGCFDYMYLSNIFSYMADNDIYETMMYLADSLNKNGVMYPACDWIGRFDLNQVNNLNNVFISGYSDRNMSFSYDKRLIKK